MSKDLDNILLTEFVLELHRVRSLVVGSRWYLFGSVLSEKQPIGDVDLLVVCSNESDCRLIRGELESVCAEFPVHLLLMTFDEEDEIKFLCGVTALEIDSDFTSALDIRYASMSNPTPSLTTETEVLREAYAALNRGDIPAFVTLLDEDAEWVEFAESPDGATYKGRAAIEAHATLARGTWAEGACEPERLIVAGDKIIVFVHVRVRLKSETDWREGRIADVYTFRNGKVIHVRLFLDRRQALEWAGASATDTD